MAGAGGVGYGLTANAGPTSTTTTDAASTPAVAPAKAVPSAATSVVRPSSAGPVLVDTAGRAVSAGLAGAVRSVYGGLTRGDVDVVRQAYSHAGSDDWYTSRSHLESQQTRTKLLAALRTAPKHTSDGSYRYQSGNYSLIFGAADASGVGLVSITGPWSTASNSTHASGTTSSVDSHAGSAKSRKTHPSTPTRSNVGTTCDMSGPPVFGDPAHPDVITNRDCGYTDSNGQARSRDSWIDGQLTSNG